MPIGSLQAHPLRTLMRAAVLTAVSLAATNCLPFQNRSSSPGLSERERVIHLLSRTTYGVRPQDLEEAMRMGRREWLERQLQPDAIPDLALDARVSSRPATNTAGARLGGTVTRMTPPQGTTPPAQMPNAAGPEIAALRELTQIVETARQQLDGAHQQLLEAQRLMTNVQGTANERDLAAARRALQEGQTRYQQMLQQTVVANRNFEELVQRMNALPNPVTPIPNAVLAPVRVTVVGVGQNINTLVANKIERAVFSERQLEEVMTDFWFNHFNVYYNKAQVRNTIVDYEQSAIREHVFGRFEDMLVATARHPAMLVYLDNFMSTAPVAQNASTNPARPARPQRGGLNENYARELMELHTLGVDGGYTQQDVVEVARAFTGWGIANRAGTATPAAEPRPQPTIEFQFNANQHDNGDKVVLGQPVAGGRGAEEGLEILGMLARHPSTARHLATKLVRHFVADDPPEALVEQIARVYLDTDGDLREVTRALFLSSEFYSSEHYRAKVKRPFEYIASALRVTGAEFGTAPVFVTQLRALKHLPYSEPAPTGYATTAEDWVSAGAMLARMNFGLDLAGGRVQGVALLPDESSGESSAGALTFSPVFDAPRATMDAASRIELQNAVQALLQHVQVGVETAELSALITEDLMREPLPPGEVAGSNPRLGLADGAVANGTPARKPLLQSAPGVVIQRRGPTARTLTPALRALGLALGSPEFQRY